MLNEMLSKLGGMVPDSLKNSTLVLTAATKAFDKLEEGKTKKRGVFERWLLAMKTFASEMGWIEKEKEEATNEASEAVSEVNEKAVETVAKEFEVNNSPAKDTETAEADLDDFLLGKSVYEALDTETKQKAQRGFTAIVLHTKNDDVKCEKEDLKAMSGVVVETLLKMREGSNKVEFEKRLAALLGQPRFANYPLNKLFNSALDLGGLKSKLKLVVGDWMLKNAADMVKEKHLKHTEKANVVQLIKMIKDFADRNDKAITAKEFTELVFLVDVRDVPELINVLYGKK
ncbi:hypothetical protein COU74_03125 [Candidatus Peregrinibacteria bacterium CG10_big_fil_rev_8_21_14_0_10_36_19]|nr:MAG: hypothetical protein COU74_03125 [Candidatus Peregrinibacteria bacterium CG10_big_fil_rev_8_21_14_0_10_36_19]